MVQVQHPVIKKAKEIAKKLRFYEEVKRFRLAEKQLNESKTVEELIQTIKKKQKELVHAKHYQKKEYTKLLEKELDEIQHYFDHLPIVKEFQQTQVEVNDLLQVVQRILFENLEKKISVEKGGKTPGGCGDQGSCS